MNMFDEKIDPTLLEGYGMPGIANSLEPLVTQFRDNLISVGNSVIKTMKTNKRKRVQRGGSKPKSTKKVKKRVQRGGGSIRKPARKGKTPQRGAGTKRKNKRKKSNF
jgi:hypothetical protein